MAAVAGERRRINVAIDMQLFINEVTVSVDDRTVTLKALGILWMRRSRRQSVTAATGGRRISGSDPFRIVTWRICLVAVGIAAGVIGGVVAWGAAIFLRQFTKRYFGAFGVIQVTRRKYSVGNRMAFSAIYWFMTGTLSQMVLMGPYPTRA